MPGYFTYGSGEFAAHANLNGAIGDREVLIPVPWGEGNITAMKATKKRPALIKITSSFVIPEGALKAGAEDVMVALGMTPFFALFCKPGTLIVPEEESEPSE